MDKPAPWPKGIARALIAGLLAWALVMQGVAAAASARGGAAFDIGLMSADVERCAADGGGDERGHSPSRHVPCSSCCIPCRSGLLGDLAGLPLALPSSVSLFFPAADVSRAASVVIVETTSPPGWTSSWSQRAPPHIFPTFLPPRALEA
jgi:hypothetical protein